MAQPLEDFVREALGRGLSREDIVRGLEQGGWSGKEIQTALDAYVETALPLPVPRKRVSGSPKEAFLYLLMFGMLYTFAVALGSILFQLIDLVLPLPGETAAWLLSSLRWGVATVVVAFPLFLFLSWLIAREAVQNPSHKISPVRRWLTYLTLLFTAVALVCDLISLILRFLEGDLTLRFGLKVLVVALIAGGAFGYYLSDLRRDERTSPLPARTRQPAAKFALAGLIGLVLVILGTAAYFAGSPGRNRLLAQDSQRVQDLRDISYKVERFYADNGKLPTSLKDCDVSPATFIENKKDRVSGEPYLYRVVDGTHFEVGATFALPSSEDEAGGMDTRFWKHEAEPAVFRIEVAQKKR